MYPFLYGADPSYGATNSRDLLTEIPLTAYTVVAALVEDDEAATP
jgi:hypothetical protein